MALPLYKINGYNLRTQFGLQVLRSGGMFDHPARIGKTEKDWHESNGFEALVDSVDLGWKHRKIQLECLMEFNDMYDFEDKIGSIKKMLYSEIIELQTPYSIHDVMLKQGAQVNFNYEHRNRAVFTLVFNEPEYNLINGLTPDDAITNQVYSIGGVDFARMGMTVNKSSGYYDFTAMKPDNYTFYNRESNKLNARIGRNIVLEITCEAESVYQMGYNHQYLQRILRSSGLKTLMIKDVTNSFEVYNKDGYRVNSIKREGNRIATTFRLVLREPQPNLEELVLAYLLDVDLNYILDVNERYIVVLWDKSEFESKIVYLHTDSEPTEPKVYLWTDNERDSGEPEYDPEAEQVFLFTDNEII